jgi:hypothetical protein
VKIHSGLHWEENESQSHRQDPKRPARNAPQRERDQPAGRHQQNCDLELSRRASSSEITIRCHGSRASYQKQRCNTEADRLRPGFHRDLICEAIRVMVIPQR